MFHAYDLFSHGMKSEPSAPPFAAELAECRGEVNPVWELLKLPFGRSQHTLPGLFLAIVEKGAGPHRAEHAEM